MGQHLKTRSLIISGVVLLASTALNADTLVLKDGRRISGRLVLFQNGIIEFQETFGQVGRISRDDVRQIEFSNLNDRNRRGNGNDDGGNERNTAGSRPRGMREKQLMIVANTAWSDTGIEVFSGQNIYFEASGEIRWGPGRRAHPDGEQNSPNNPARPIPNRPGASLIGRVGNSNDYFFVGNERGAIRMRSSGRLYLGINDDNLRDNTGYFTVIVYY